MDRTICILPRAIENLKNSQKDVKAKPKTRGANHMNLVIPRDLTPRGTLTSSLIPRIRSYEL